MRTFARFVAVMALAATQARATVLVGETFTYSDGALTNVSGNAWVGFSGNTTQLNVSNGQAVVSGGLTQDVGINLATPGASNGVIYAAFDVNFTSWPTGAGAYFAVFKDNTTSHFRARVMVTNDSGSVRIGIANASSPSSAAGVAFEATTLSLGTTYRVVVRYDQSGTAPVATLWVNPTLESDPSVSASDVVGAPIFIPITQFALRQSNAQQGIVTVDNLLIATSLAAPIPEPSTIALVGAGMLGLFALRRCRDFRRTPTSSPDR